MVRDNVESSSRVHTDANLKYRGLSDPYEHDYVSHSDGEYARDMIHTNGIESVWALFKRQLIGTHHWVSKKHLQAYLNEMTWRLNRREQGDGERVKSFLSKVEGRLTYKELTA